MENIARISMFESPGTDNNFYFSSGYLSRCQVETPDKFVKWVWERVIARRPNGVSSVLDLGAGDGKFSKYGLYKNYTGVEIDATKIVGNVESRMKMVHGCALVFGEKDYDVCIGNPPFVKHHDINDDWRELIIQDFKEITRASIDRRSNAYLYFILKGLLSTKENGLVAQIVPFEWITRPSSNWLRKFIREKGWDVYAYRLPDSTFKRVLTTSSLTIIDKGESSNEWRFFNVDEGLEISESQQPSGNSKRVIAYSERKDELYAQRGLSPGTQKVFCITETERQRSGLSIGKDVMPCVKSLRPVG
ncbi:MAG: hypothetical protein AB2653_03020, partial [Candidatus Thiodiazotropha endolucinida]